MPNTILGLDCSSTCIGYAVVCGDTIQHYSAVPLTGDIDARCSAAASFVATLLDTRMPTLVIIESPVAKYAKAVIPQARVSGAILAVLHRHLALWREVAPALAKQTLANKGNADKEQMIRAACNRLGVTPTIIKERGKIVGVWPEGRMTEDEADAIGLACVGAAMKIVVTKESA